jgi:sodium/bile acid cotransporter 7
LINNLRAVRASLGRAGINGFLFLLVFLVWLAWLWPAPGNLRGPFSLQSLADVGVAVIFFFYGLRLNPTKLREGVGNWRLHLVVQLVTFVLCPLIAVSAKFLYGGRGHEDLWLGVLYLSVLPGTVSSAIVMISMAGGNIPGGIFNASLASLLGIFVTPLWMGYFLKQEGAGGDFTHIILTLILQVLVPVIGGILFHSRGGGFAERHRHGLRLFDQGVILLIVYNAFCESFAGNMFAGISLPFLLELGIVLVVSFLVLCVIVYGICRALHFSEADTITAVFCGSKKSLVHGTVMGNVIFGQGSSLGLLMLPLMLYHALQLIAASIIAESIAQRRHRVSGASSAPGGPRR